jgi:hypothetical protein
MPVELEVIGFNDASRQFYPLGVWILGGTDYDQLCRTAFKDVKEHGCNSIWWAAYQPRDSSRILSLARKENLRVVMGGNIADDIRNTKLPTRSTAGELLTEDDVFAAIKKAVDRYRGVEELLGYNTYSEPDYLMASNLGLINRISGQLDPVHPSIITLNQAATLEHFVKESDLPLMVHDNYEEIDTLAVQTKQAAFVAKKFKIPFWMMLSSTTNGNKESDEEVLKLRTRTYIAMAAGAKGIFYWWYQSMTSPAWYGFVDTEFKPSRKWDSMKKLSSEIMTLSPVLLNSEIQDDAVSLKGQGMVTTLRDRSQNMYAAVVNTSISQSLNGELSLPAGFTDAENVLDKMTVPVINSKCKIMLPPGCGEFLKLRRTN